MGLDETFELNAASARFSLSARRPAAIWIESEHEQQKTLRQDHADH